MTKAEQRTHDAVQTKISEIVAGQFAHASEIEKALRKYERQQIRIRNVGEYISLLNHLRLIAGLSTEKAEHQFSGDDGMIMYPVAADGTPVEIGQSQPKGKGNGNGKH